MATAINNTTSTAPNAAPPEQREAIIFLPGLGREQSDQTIEGVTWRFMNAMDRNSATASSVFRLGEIRVENYGQHSQTRVCSIFRKDQESDKPVVDVYALHYHDNFFKQYDSMPLFLKSLLVGLTMIIMSLRIVRSLRNPAQTLQAKVQIILSVVALSILIMYIGLLLYAAVDTVSEAFLLNGSTPVASQASTPEAAAPPAAATAQSAGPTNTVQSGLVSFRNWLTEAIANFNQFLDLWANPIVITLTALGVVLPTRSQAREFVVKNATNYTALVMYLTSGERRNVLLGQLSELIDHIESKPSAYTRVAVMGYSFGGLIALDALFPPDIRPGTRFRTIAALITIAVPFDFVRSFWPKYFEQRHTKPNPALTWLNVYSPDDVLSSNFRNDGKIGPADVNVSNQNIENDAASAMAPENIAFKRRVNQEELTWLDVITFMGLRSHGMYWEKDNEPQINCFDDIVNKLYENHVFLK